MPSVLTKKLSHFADLSADDRSYLDSLATDMRSVKAGCDLITEGERPERVFLLVEGWAFRYKMLPDGGRQIMAMLIPGDLCDIHIFILKTMDHSIGLLSDAKVAAIPQDAMRTALRERPAVAEALFWATLVDEAVLREWLVNLGRRDAFERVAHFLCEMRLRMRQVGLVTEDGFSLPLTQEQLGDVTGLTSVHVNRVLQRLRSEGLISLAHKDLVIHHPDRLEAVAGFNPNYLHLDRRE